MISAVSAAGMMNCQTDMPAARATISSSLRVRSTKVAMEPNSTAKGRIISAAAGTFMAVISATVPAPAGRIVACAAQHLDEDDDEGEAENRKEDRQDRAHETHGEIARYGHADHGRAPAAERPGPSGAQLRLIVAIGPRLPLSKKFEP